MSSLSDANPEASLWLAQASANSLNANHFHTGRASACGRHPRIRTVTLVHYNQQAQITARGSMRFFASRLKVGGIPGAERLNTALVFRTRSSHTASTPASDLASVSGAYITQSIAPRTLEAHSISASQGEAKIRTEESAEHRVGPRRALVQEYGRSQCYNELYYPTRCLSERRCGCLGFQRLDLGCEYLSGYLDQSCLRGGELYGISFTFKTTPHVEANLREVNPVKTLSKGK